MTCSKALCLCTTWWKNCKFAKKISPISGGIECTLFSRRLRLVNRVKFLMSGSIVVILLKRRNSIDNDLNLYTTAGISRSLLCLKVYFAQLRVNNDKSRKPHPYLRSSIFNSWSVLRASGNVVRWFSCNANVVNLVRQPTSSGTRTSLFLYKKSSLSWHKSLTWVDKVTSSDLLKSNLVPLSSLHLPIFFSTSWKSTYDIYQILS